MKIRGSVIFITGAAQRIGRSLALDLASRGAKLVVHYGQSSRQARSLQTQVEKKYQGILKLVQGDLTRFEEVQRVAREAWEAFGHVDVLINNASTFFPTPLGKVSEQDWDNLFSVNAKAPFFLSEFLGLRMKKARGGKILQMADWAAHRPYLGYLPYCASKAALLCLSQGLAKSLAPQVQVNSVLLGPILWKDQDEDTRLEVLKKIPLSRTGHPRDVVNAVRFFIENDFMTGAELHVDGGRHVE